MPNPTYPCIAQSFKPGDKLAGCFTLKEILPVEGLCVVWLAHDEELGKDIALHFVPDSVAADPQAMTDLKQEAKRNRQLIHPRIVRVHDLVEDEKWAAISMDLVQGETLASLQKKRDKNAFNPSEIAAGISELCQTLEDAHRIDLFHRDLAPENLVSTGSGLMVQKFGISRVILDSLARGGRKIEGARDIAYISPQQLDGEPIRRGDDLYSLGATLFDLLTGAPPFVGDDVVSQIRKVVPPPVSARRAERQIGGEPVSKAWDETIAACLAKVPDQRPKSAADAGARFVSGKPAEAAAATPPPEKPAEAAKTPSEQDSKQQKRPWASGPGKAPVIAEATVLSKTAVPKGEGKEAAAETPAGGAKKGGPTSPSGFPLRAFVEVDGDAKPPKSKSYGGLIATAVVIIFVIGLIVAKNHNGSSENTAPENTAATTGSSGPQAASADATAAPDASAAPTSTPETVAAADTPAAAEPAATPAPAVVAESPAPISNLASMTDDQINQLVAQKAAAVQKAQADLAAAEAAARDKAAAQTQAASAVQQLQATIKQKTDDAAAAKKAADDAAATLKQQQDALQKAAADAAEAQKVAAAKAQAAEQLQKSVQDAQAAVEQQQSAQEKAEADANQAAAAAKSSQAAADAAAKAVADAEKARAQLAQAVSFAQADLSQVQTGIQQAQQSRNAEKARKAAEDAARIKVQREAETARLAAQAAAAAKAAEDAQKALAAAQKAVADAERAQREAEAQAEAARNGALPMESAAPTAPAAPTEAAPSAVPVASPAASPTLSVHALSPHMRVDQALNNSLGMRFAPVGNVFFCVWLTRVQDFEAFAAATGYKSNAWREPGFTQAPDHPVVNVSWNDANLFCLWLTEKEHREGILAPNETYRLPTDLEWSNAVGLPAESGRTPEVRDMDIPDVYPWGTQWPPPAGSGNYTGEETDSDVAIKGYNDGFAWTSPVGSFNANKFGLYDMGGNVWEWCGDWWNAEQKSKVLRGGSWYNGALKLSLLSSCRIHASADQGTDNYGFRVIIAQEATKAPKHRPPAVPPSPSPRHP